MRVCFLVSYNAADQIVQANDCADGPFVKNLAMVLGSVINDICTEQGSRQEAKPFLLIQEPIRYAEYRQNPDGGYVGIRQICVATQDEQEEQEKYGD